MKKIFAVVMLVVLIFMLTGEGYCQGPGGRKLPPPKTIYVKVNGRTFRVLGIQTPRGTFLEAYGIGKALKKSVSYGEGTSVTIGSQTFNRSLDVSGKRYIPSRGISKKLGYTTSQSGTTITFTPSSGSSSSSSTSSSGAGNVSLSVSSKSKADTSNPDQVMWSLEVNFTNKGDKAVQFTNNNLLLQVSSGKTYRVTRARFSSVIFLNPGESKSGGRIYFVISKNDNPQTIILKKENRVLGKTTF